MLVELFVPCFVDQLFPYTAFNMIKVLEKAGCEVHYNPNQTCCSQPAFNAGFWKEARDVAWKFAKDFAVDHPIVAPSASCVGYVRNHFGQHFTDSSLHNDCKKIQRNIYELSEFLVDVLKVEDLGSSLEGVATYHDSCSALRECNIKAAPRKLLSHVKGLTLVEMADTETCCGFGGTFAVKFEPISSGMAEQRIDTVLETGAEILVSTDLSCLMHMDGMIRKKQHNIKIMHLADVLASGLS